MSGKNQHHIPRFLQRGFAAADSDGHKIWHFTKEFIPKKPRSIRSTATEDWFYSEPSTDGSPTLDDEITDQEQPIVVALAAQRSEAIGASVAPEIAAGLVHHFAPRTAHFRQTLEHGMRQLVTGAAELFTDEEKLSALFGIDQATPNEVFRARAGEMLRENEAIASLQLPDHVIERMAFYVAKEQFQSSLGETIPAFRRLFRDWFDAADEVARRGHNKALANREGPNARRALLETLHWRIAAPPPEGAILPDCVALALAEDGAAPLMLANLEEARAVIMPLSTASLLVGTLDDHDLPADFEFNRAAASASLRFFLAGSNAPAIVALQSLIDERSSSLIDEAVAHAFKDLLPPEPTPEPLPDDDEMASDTDDPKPDPSTAWNYQVSFVDCADEPTAAKISDAVNQVVGALGRSLPLRRLEGITFASDYPAALQAIDRGIPGLRPPSTMDPSIGIGIGQTVNIVRDDTVMCRIVLNGAVAHALVADEAEQSDWAIGILVRQLTLVALVEIEDVTLPGFLLRPVPDPLQGWLYGAVGPALDGYIAAHIGAGFGDPDEMADGFRELLTEALDRMRETVLAARLSYRYHGDLDELLAVTKPAIRHVLLFASDLLGHCAALGQEAVMAGSALESALERAGLRLWLPRYYADLEAFRRRIGQWKSIDEFMAFTVHVERLMWQLGMIPWSTDEGMRVDIPLWSDAAALMADMASGGANDAS